MSEIKFACPQCRQHIACDGDFHDLWIDCPSCGQTLVVPRMTTADAARPGGLIVASSPSARPRTTSHIPTLQPWTEANWAEHTRQQGGALPDQAPIWAAALFGTLVVAFVLKLDRVGWMPILACLVLGGAISGVLLAKRDPSGAGEILKGLAFVLAAIITVPIVGLGLLFLGCTMCH